MLGCFRQAIESFNDPSPSKGGLRFLWRLRGSNHRDSSFGVQRDGDEILEAKQTRDSRAEIYKRIFIRVQEFNLARYVQGKSRVDNRTKS